MTKIYFTFYETRHGGFGVSIIDQKTAEKIAKNSENNPEYDDLLTCVAEIDMNLNFEYVYIENMFGHDYYGGEINDVCKHVHIDPLNFDSDYVVRFKKDQIKLGAWISESYGYHLDPWNQDDQENQDDQSNQDDKIIMSEQKITKSI